MPNCTRRCPIAPVDATSQYAASAKPSREGDKKTVASNSEERTQYLVQNKQQRGQKDAQSPVHATSNVEQHKTELLDGNKKTVATNANRHTHRIQHAVANTIWLKKLMLFSGGTI
jgi:hypothetical protein